VLAGGAVVIALLAAFATLHHHVTPAVPETERGRPQHYDWATDIGRKDNTLDPGGRIPARPATALVISVRSDAGAPIEGAMLALYESDTHGSPIVTGHSNGNGEWRHDNWVSSASAWLRASARGHTTVDTELPSTNNPVIVTLARIQNLLEGTVLLPSGATAGAGTWVLAYPEFQTQPTASEVADAIAGRGDLPITTTDDHGRFSMTVEVGRSYALHAGADGWMTATPKRRCEVGVQHTLDLLHVWGARIHVMSSVANEKIELSSVLQARDWNAYLWSEFDGAEKPLMRDDIGFVLAGGIPDLTEMLPLSRLMLVAGTSSVDRAEPIKLRVQFPGYEIAEQSFAVTSINLGLSEVVLQLTKRCASFGTIRLRVQCSDAELPGSVGEGHVRGALLLRDASARVDEYPASLSTGEVCVVDTVPQGLYTAVFRRRDGAELKPTQPAFELIGEHELTFDYDRYGAIRFSVLGANEESPSDELLIGTLGKGPPRKSPDGRIQLVGGIPVRVHELPYVLGPLSPGKYSFRRQIPKTDEEVFSVEVVPGRVTELAMRK
jgi:hypothetical protein